jgi:tetratricopeptide (TPR) repeat protein
MQLNQIFLIAALAVLPFFVLAADDSIVKIPDTDWEIRLEYARVLSYQKQYKESLEEYKKIIDKYPDLVEAKVEMAKIYYYEHEYDLATKMLNEIPESAVTPSLEVIQGDIAIAQKNYPLAEKYLLHSLESNPEKKDSILFKLAELYSWQKKYPQSIEIYQKLVAAHPNDIQLKRKYALVLSWAGKNEEAAELLKSTLE